MGSNCEVDVKVEHLGVFDIENKVKEFKFPCGRQQKKRKQYLGKYLLGNGNNTSDPSKAADLFLEREYPEVKNCNEEPHAPIFVPDTFFHTSVGKQYAVTPEGRGKEQAPYLEKDDSSFEGSRVEETLYNKIKLCFGKHKNVAIFSGWNDQQILDKDQREFDFLILSASSRRIIQIEVKKKFSPKELLINSDKSSAVSQLEKGMTFFQNFFKFQEGWQYVKAVYFGNKKDAPESKFILSLESDLIQFFNNHLRPSVEPDTTTYTTIIKVLMFVLFHHKKPIITLRDSTVTTVTKMEEFGSAENVMFWTRKQFELQNPAGMDKVVLSSIWGTGKTELLKWKMKQVLKEFPERKVFLIVFENVTTNKESDTVQGNLLLLSLQNELETVSPNIKFHSMKYWLEMHI